MIRMLPDEGRKRRLRPVPGLRMAVTSGRERT